MGRLRFIDNTRGAPVRSRLIPVRVNNSGNWADGAWQERRSMYQSKLWKIARKSHLSSRCLKCRAYASVLDHFVGHRDDEAARVAERLGVHILPTWQERFYVGPFISLCDRCHSTKTVAEKNGKLMDWVTVMADPQGNPRRW